MSFLKLTNKCLTNIYWLTFVVCSFWSQTLFNPNKTVVKMFVVMYDLRSMPAGHQTFLRQRTFSVPVRRESNNQTSRKPLAMGHGRTLRYLVHLRLNHRPFVSVQHRSFLCSLLTFLCLFVNSTQVPELQVWKDLPPQGHPPAVLQKVHGGGQWCCLRTPVLHRVACRPTVLLSLLRSDLSVHRPQDVSVTSQYQRYCSKKQWGRLTAVDDILQSFYFTLEFYLCHQEQMKGAMSLRKRKPVWVLMGKVSVSVRLESVVSLGPRLKRCEDLTSCCCCCCSFVDYLLCLRRSFPNVAPFCTGVDPPDPPVPPAATSTHSQQLLLNFTSLKTPSFLKKIYCHWAKKIQLQTSTTSPL